MTATDTAAHEQPWKEAECPECDGDGYQERFNDDQTSVVTWLCPACDGTGQRPPYQPTAQEWSDAMGGDAAS